MELATATAAVASTASAHHACSRFYSSRRILLTSSSFPSSSRSLSTSASTSLFEKRRFPVASAAVELRKTSGGGESVRVTETLQPGSSVMFSVEVPPSIIQECYETTLLEYSKRFKVGSWAYLDRSSSGMDSWDKPETSPTQDDVDPVRRSLVARISNKGWTAWISQDVHIFVSNFCQFVIARLLKRPENSKVPGFRPGKLVPENVLINYVGPQHVQAATVEAILRHTLPQALSSVEDRALEDSVRILTKFDDMTNSFSLEDVFRYDVSVDVVPEVRWLSEDKYKNLKVVIEIDEIVDAEKAAELELKRRRKSLGLLRIVTDRGLQVGDLAVLDIFAETINRDGSKGEKIPSAESTGFHLDTEENNNLVPGFLGSLIGIRPGETRSFPIQFPESFEQESLQGVRAQFTVVCKELFFREVPDLNDSIAAKILPGCTTMDQVRERILERCKEVEKTAIEQATDNAILDQLGKLVEVDVPRSLFQEQGQQLYGAKLLQLQAERKLDKDQLASLSSERSVQEYLESERESINRIIKQMLAVGEIFKSENLQYSTDQLIKEVENSIEEFKRYNQDYDEGNIKQQVQDVLEAAKVLEWLKENCTIEYIRR